MYHVPLAFQGIYRYSDEGGGNGDGKEGRVEITCANDLVLCGESEEDLRGRWWDSLLRCLEEVI